jgi:flagellar motor switch protein FliN/FliY
VKDTDIAKQAALAALTNMPIADPLVVGEPTSDPAKLRFEGVAVSARFTGTRSGEVLVAVERALADALRNSPLGALDLTAALSPALGAAASTVGVVVTGPGQALEPGPALDALLGKPNASVVPLLHDGVVRAIVGIALSEESGATALHTTPQYPTAEELRRSSMPDEATRSADAARRGLELLRDVNMEVTARIGSTRMTINELLTLADGAVVELDRAAGAPADLLVNGHLIARGEVVVIDENFALRITEIVVDETAAPGS